MGVDDLNLHLGKEASAPGGWKETREWLRSFTNTDIHPKLAQALRTDVDSDQFVMRRLGTTTTAYEIASTWVRFSLSFPSDTVAMDMAALLQKTIKDDETKAIRIMDTIFDSSAAAIGLTSIRDIGSYMSERDWQHLMADFVRPDSIFLSDLEMDKINKTPRSADPNLRPARYVVGALFSGTREINEARGDFEKSLEYYKNHDLKA